MPPTGKTTQDQGLQLSSPHYAVLKFIQNHFIQFS